MKDCDRYQQLIESQIAEEISERNREALEAHSNECWECRDLLEMHRILLDEAGEIGGSLDDEDFEWMRQQVLSKAGRAAPPGPGWSWATPFLRSRLIAAVAAGLLLLLSGGLLGRWTASDSQNPSLLLKRVNEEAVANRQLEDVENSPYIISNADFRRLSPGRVALSFDVTSRVQVEQPIESPLVKEVLVQSLLSSSSLGARLKAMSYAGQMMDPKVKEALILAMLEDPSLAVRLEALSILSQHSADVEVQNAFLATLRRDGAVQMRLSALDYLSKQDLDPELIRRTILESDSESDPAVLLHAARFFNR